MKFDEKMSFLIIVTHFDPFHIKTTDLIFVANQITGFYMEFKTGLKQMKADFDKINLKINSTAVFSS